jgi:hypothetical protein
MPDEVLEQFVLVLALNDDTGGFNNVTNISNELLSLVGELGGVDGRVLNDVSKSGVDLIVRGHFALTKRGDDAIETYLDESATWSQELDSVEGPLPCDLRRRPCLLC